MIDNTRTLTSNDW